ncbi:tricarballylate dehydrogenase [Magnetospirillum fulvum]|uniref:Tricarballylate dehydrogenase n=1 Tax=Magnetospirillum fulvum TaxID=1082 RepID=A0A1H6H3U9_MAGFU|nr:tricarballylate dehydrogenase [Magnetospirillum fulvum]
MTPPVPPSPDLPVGAVVVIGGGTAALCAAIAARRAGASVILLDRAPPENRGGNTRHSRNLRIMHCAPSPLFPGSYDEADFHADLTKAAEGAGDEALGRLLIRRSAAVPDWLAAQGVAFQTIACGGLPWSRKTAFFLGGGTAMINTLYATATRLGIDIRHRSHVIGLSRDGAVTLADGAGGTRTVRARAVVVASGGYQANPVWLAEQWGDDAAELIVRGTPFAAGEPLRALFDLGAASVGTPGACHLVAVDGRLTEADGGIVTRVDGLDLGIAIDRDGKRFEDETTITGPTRYAQWGRRVAALPGRIAHAVWDADAVDRVPPAIVEPIRVESLEALAAFLAVPIADLAASAADSGRVTRAPFFTVPIRPGLTFTCYGVRIDDHSRVLTPDGEPLGCLFAAGMIMAPNVIGTGYLAGAALTIGAVFGRIAGEEAAEHALG